MRLNQYLPEHHEHVRRLLAHAKYSNLQVTIKLEKDDPKGALCHLENEKNALRELSRLQDQKKESDLFVDFYNSLDVDCVDWASIKKVYSR